jgi:serine/threonine-protein kinase RsbW
LSLTIGARTECIAQGRRWVTAQAVLSGASPGSLARITLLASELIANAVLHGPADGVVVVRTGVTGAMLRVEVDDQAAALPRVRQPDPHELGGRGMLLVDTYAARWGCDLRSPVGKTVWFESEM